MKPRPLRLPTSVVGSVLALSAVAGAATQTWSSANADNNWNNTAPNWDANVAWTSGNSALFGGTGETVSVTETITADTLTFDVGGYTISGSTLTLAGGQTVQVTNSGQSATFTASLAGGTLTKSGAGTLVLNAANSLTNVSVTAGTLAITGQYTNNRLSNGAVVQVASGATVDIRTDNPLPTNNAQNVTSFVLNGGTLTSTGGSHTHLGSVTLNGGTLTTASGSSTYDSERWKAIGDFTVGGSAASTISGNGVGLVGARTFTVADATGDSNVDLTVSADLNNGELSTGSLIKAGAGRMNLGTASYTGSTTVNAGHLAVSGALRGTSSLTVNSGATLELGAVNLLVSGHGVAVDNARVLQASGGTLLMNASMDSRIGNVTLGNGATWTSNRALSGYDVLLANTSTGAATVTVANTGGNTSASVMNGSGGIHLAGVQRFDVADVTGSASADLTVSMILDNGGISGGTGGINKLGAGTMAISTRTTYTGGTTVTAGVLDLTGSGGAAGVIRGTATVLSGATLRFSTGDASGYATDSTRLSTIQIQGGTLAVNSTSNQTLGSALIQLTGGSITGIANSNLDFFGGSSSLETLASADSSVIGGVSLSPLRQGSTTFTVADGAAAVDLRIDSVLRNSPSGNAGGSVLIKAGAGTLQLTANNTLTNGLTINAGVLDIAANGLFRDASGAANYNSSAVVTVNTGGSLRLKSFAYDGDGGLGGLRDYASNRVINGGVLEVVGASHSSGNDFTVGANGGTFRYKPTTLSDTLTLAGNANTNTTLNGPLTFDTLGNITVSDTLAGSGSLTKTGAGTLTLGASTTYGGLTTISTGTLALGANGALASSSGLAIAAGATFDVSAKSGGFALGATQTLAGGGSIVGDLTVLGTHAPGFSPGEQTVTGDLAYGTGSTIAWELTANTTAGRGTNWDAITVGGDLSFQGPTVLNANFAASGSTVNFSDVAWSTALGLAGGGWRIFDIGGSVSGLDDLSLGGTLLDSTGANFATVRPDQQFAFYQHNGGVYLTTLAIPEPGSAFALAALLGGGLAMRRRRA